MSESGVEGWLGGPGRPPGAGCRGRIWGYVGLGKAEEGWGPHSRGRSQVDPRPRLCPCVPPHTIPRQILDTKTSTGQSFRRDLGT